MKNILIAGPCSAESQNQMLQSAALLSLINDKAILRAGCWKPRTNPGGFEGYGVDALRWLQYAAESYQLEWMTECGSAKHAEEILRHNGKQFWIGARTTGDPFAVEEIARTMAGTNIDVWIKNPPQPDLKLWLGAAERFTRHGIVVKGLIHRGFKVWPASKLRNEPIWSLVRELRQETGDVPIICDPSHMAGRKDLVNEIAITAARRNADGWMIEMHPDVSCALTDKEQQLSPHELLILWQVLEQAKPSEQIQNLRGEVDELDELLWNAMRERFRLTSRIGRLKSTGASTILQPDRMRQVQGNYIRLATDAKLNSGLANKMFRIVHEESVRLQRIQPALH